MTYPSEFVIPSNVRFIGTLNLDATTNAISPKVIDRSYAIELQTMLHERKEIEKEREN